MLNMAQLRTLKPVIVALGSHPGIIQSMLDYDYCIGRDKPSLVGIIAGGHAYERYFWGEEEITLPVYQQLATMPETTRSRVTCLLNVQSARKVERSMREALELLPNVRLAAIFAEQVPEQHSLAITELAKSAGVIIIGPASVGIVLPGLLKLGAIGGTGYRELAAANIFGAGDTAIVSTSGGMVNEMIHTVTGAGHAVSFAMALGGDRYPITTPADAFLYAQADLNTKRIVYFGELGGDDEYALAELIEQRRVTKPVIAYIAGIVAELFTEPPQFGHAKAMASSQLETAAAKKAALRAAGVQVVDSFGDIVQLLVKDTSNTQQPAARSIGARTKRLFASHISGDRQGDIQLLGRDLLEIVEANTLASLILSMLLGEQITSKKLIGFTDYVLRLLTDHGPYVSGAINTIVTARAGKDLASSLAAGILTIGPRFGGAVNEAAGNWLTGVQAGLTPKTFVADFTARNYGAILGIGHKKYRIDLPDPRVAALIQQFGGQNHDTYLTFARAVEMVTTSKKGNLILNVDGAIAAIMLDMLTTELGYSVQLLQQLIDCEFFNALFILSRSAGLAAHYIDQRRHDEGLLRLGEEQVSYINSIL